MKQRRRIYYSESQKALMWERWRKGESLQHIAQLFNRNHSSVQNIKFDFLGYTFRPRAVKNRKRNSMFVSFTPAVSSAALKSMQQTTRKANFRNRTPLSLRDIARAHNPVLRGWFAYYGRFCPSAMYPVFKHFNRTLVAWAMRKYKRLKGHKIRASRFIQGIAKQNPNLFVHWRRGVTGMDA